VRAADSFCKASWELYTNFQEALEKLREICEFAREFEKCQLNIK
jgi:hypothetical protein